MNDPKERVSLPPDPNPRKPRFAPPPGTCDTHFHLFGPPHRFPYADTRLYTPPAAPLEHFFSMAAIVGIERGVIVQPNVHGFDNGIVLDGIARSDGRLRGMIRANAALEPADYRRLHDGGIRGVRFNYAQHLKGGIDHRVRTTVVERIAPHGWPADFHIDAGRLVELADTLRKLPCNVVIDHFARVDMTAGVAQEPFRVLLDLMGEPNMWVKISGADRFVAKGARYEDAVPFARALIAKAPDRVIWGTDWPHSNIFVNGLTPNDGFLMDLMLDFAPDETARRKVLSDNPARLFGFDR